MHVYCIIYIYIHRYNLVINLKLLFCLTIVDFTSEIIIAFKSLEGSAFLPELSRFTAAKYKNKQTLIEVCACIYTYIHIMHRCKYVCSYLDIDGVH